MKRVSFSKYSVEITDKNINIQTNTKTHDGISPLKLIFRRIVQMVIGRQFKELREYTSKLPNTVMYSVHVYLHSLIERMLSSNYYHVLITTDGSGQQSIVNNKQHIEILTSYNIHLKKYFDKISVSI